VSTNKILVIDDSRVIRKTVRDMLPEGDFEVIEAKDGLEGIDFIEKERPSLIMLDFILPKMSGWDVFQQIQSNPDYQKIPLVLMSGKKEEVTSKIAEPFEFFEFIEKPFDRVLLQEAIRVAMVKVRKARPRVAELPGSGSIGGDTQVSNDEIIQLQAQIAQIQAAHSTEIQELQSQILAASQYQRAEIQALAAQFEAFQQTKTTAHQPTIEKVIQLETEVDTLKKQLGQLIVLIKKKFAV
jgi:CheY-like chemotaxis protein